jgi:hypothetical protein
MSSIAVALGGTRVSNGEQALETPLKLACNMRVKRTARDVSMFPKKSVFEL